jgi:hypothetical protein
MPNISNFFGIGGAQYRNKHWELSECLRQYYQFDTQNPIRKNLEFFILLRNKIEHRSLPELDSDIFGECQAMLLNFDDMIEKEFGEEYCIRESLSFALQLFPSPQNLIDAVKHSPSLESVKNFINNYRSSISIDVWQSGKYSFKAFLIQVANHPNADALSVQFVHYDKLSEEQKEEISRFVAFIKYKQVPVSNADKMRPGEVIKKMQQGLGDPKVNRNNKQVDKFNSHTHRLCWKKYKVRPDGNSDIPEETNTKYCVYDKPHKDYVYTQDWVDFLIENLKDENEFNSLYKVNNEPYADLSG